MHTAGLLSKRLTQLVTDPGSEPTLGRAVPLLEGWLPTGLKRPQSRETASSERSTDASPAPSAHRPEPSLPHGRPHQPCFHTVASCPDTGSSSRLSTVVCKDSLAAYFQQRDGVASGVPSPASRYIQPSSAQN